MAHSTLFHLNVRIFRFYASRILALLGYMYTKHHDVFVRLFLSNHVECTMASAIIYYIFYIVQKIKYHRTKECDRVPSLNLFRVYAPQENTTQQILTQCVLSECALHTTFYLQLKVIIQSNVINFLCVLYVLKLCKSAKTHTKACMYLSNSHERTRIQVIYI